MSRNALELVGRRSGEVHRARAGRIVWSLLFCLLSVALFDVAAQAQVPEQVAFQGLLLDDQGEAITGPVDLEFELFDDLVVGASLWSETQNGVMVTDGVYAVTLGSVVPLDETVLGAGAVFLAITVDGELLTPRQQLLSVPFALRALQSESVGSVSSLYMEQMIESYSFDGQEPGNLDPEEGTGDTDLDGTPNFIDPDNDGDGVLDGDELAAGTAINLVTPVITNVSPDPIVSYVTTTLTVTGTSFDTLSAVSFGPETPTAAQLTSTSFEIDVTPDHLAPSLEVGVSLGNGESAVSLPVTISNVAPTISSTSPTTLPLAPVELVVNGTNFVPGTTVMVGSQLLVPTALSATSLTVQVAAEPLGVVSLEVRHPNGLTASVLLANYPVGSILTFLSAGSYSGNLGGVAGADAACQAEADAASLPGTFRAWISDSTTSPAARFSQSEGPYVLVDGTVVAEDWADLTDGSIGTSLDVLADGSRDPVLLFVWTGTDVDGTPVEPASSRCEDWMTTFGAGEAGVSNASGPTWTNEGPRACFASSGRLYCFGQ